MIPGGSVVQSTIETNPRLARILISLKDFSARILVLFFHIG